MKQIFADRRTAGRLLALMLVAYRDRDDVTVLALPRGGVLVAAEIADALRAPLDVITVRKLGVPDQPELAMGAIAGADVVVLEAGIIDHFGITGTEIDTVMRREERELERRERTYRMGAPPPRLTGRTAILVDDGIATGATMRAAIRAARGLGAAEVVVAVPVAARQSRAELERECDGVIVARMPGALESVGAWYEDFHPVSDAEVIDLLTRHPASRSEPTETSPS